MYPILTYHITVFCRQFVSSQHLFFPLSSFTSAKMGDSSRPLRYVDVGALVLVQQRSADEYRSESISATLSSREAIMAERSTIMTWMTLSSVRETLVARSSWLPDRL